MFPDAELIVDGKGYTTDYSDKTITVFEKGFVLEEAKYLIIPKDFKIYELNKVGGLEELCKSKINTMIQTYLDSCVGDLINGELSIESHLQGSNYTIEIENEVGNTEEGVSAFANNLKVSNINILDEDLHQLYNFNFDFNEEW
jgi:hypothetical protein